MSEPKASVGRAVHYVSYGTPGGEYKPACRAATGPEVTGEHKSLNGTYGPVVGLCVLNPTGLFFNQGVAQDQGTDVGPDSGSPLCGSRVYEGGSWHWPERVS